MRILVAKLGEDDKIFDSEFAPCSNGSIRLGYGAIINW